MGKNSELKIPCLKTHNFEAEEYNTFVEIVGKENASKELRAMIRNFIAKQQNKQSTLTDIFNFTDATLDKFVKLEPDISTQIHKIEDIQYLESLEKNANLIRAIAKTRKKNVQSELLKAIQNTKK